MNPSRQRSDFCLPFATIGHYMSNINFSSFRRPDAVQFFFLFVFGMFLTWQNDLALSIGESLVHLTNALGLRYSPKNTGILVAMFSFGVSSRFVNLTRSLLQDSQKSRQISFPVKLSLRLIATSTLQVVAACTILWLVLMSEAYQRSVSDNALSVFSTALLLHIFSGAIADSTKNVFVCVILHCK